MPAFIRSSTVQQAEQEALRLGVKSADYRQSLVIGNDVNAIFEQIIQKGGVLPHYVEVDDAVFISWGKQYSLLASYPDIKMNQIPILVSEVL